MARTPQHLIGEVVDIKALQMAIATWKVATGQPQYRMAEELGISPDFLSQIAHGIRPGYQHTQRIMSLAQQASGRRVS